MKRDENQRSFLNGVKQNILSLFPFNSVGDKPDLLHTVIDNIGSKSLRKLPSERKLPHMRRGLSKIQKQMPATHLAQRKTNDDPPTTERDTKVGKRPKRMLLDLLPYNNVGLKSSDPGEKHESTKQPTPQQTIKKLPKRKPKRQKRMLSDLLPYNNVGLKSSDLEEEQKSPQHFTPQQSIKKSPKRKPKRQKRMLSDLLPYNNVGLKSSDLEVQQNPLHQPTLHILPRKSSQRPRTYSKRMVSDDNLCDNEDTGESMESTRNQPLQKSRRKVPPSRKRMLSDLLPHNKVGLKSLNPDESGSRRRKEQQPQAKDEKSVPPSQPSKPRRRPKRMLADLMPHNTVGLKSFDVDSSGGRKRKRTPRQL